MKEFILPIRDLIVHPGLTIPIYIDNPISITCVEEAMKKSQKIVLVAQNTWNYPINPGDIHKVGTIGKILQVLRMPDGAVHSIIATESAVNISDVSIEKGLFLGKTENIDILDDSKFEQTIALRDKIAENLQLIPAIRKFKMDKLRSVMQDYPLPAFVDSVIQMMNIETDIAIKILAVNTWRQKLLMLLEQINLTAEMVKIEDSINRRVQMQMETGRRDAILQEKLRAIQKEMGDNSDKMDADSLDERIKKTKLHKDAKEKALSELKRMRGTPPMSQENGLIKSYLDELLSMPWGKSDKSVIDLDLARKILDEEHSGMNPIKERILEHIAVMKKTGKNQGTVICLVGAPGVGKTSLGKSVAKALGRKYQRISLGGVSDEAHFRGHRKTYIGSQPGRIMDTLKRSGANNPVIVLDEIDKMGRDHRGDPASALLEILDPEQNKSFRDHYLEVDFDLSNVLFIATANTLNISAALKDRMEIIEIPGYTEEEKIQIAQEHLIKRVAYDTGWDVKNINIDRGAISYIIRNHTSEQGVRELQRELTAVLRRSLLENDGEDLETDFTIEKINKLLSIRKSVGLSKKIGFSARS